MSKNRDAKRKAKIKAQKAQAIQQSQARNERVADAIMDICSPLAEQYIDPEKTPDVTGWLVLWCIGRIAWNLTLTGRRDISQTDLDETDLDADNKEILAENISLLIRRKYELYPQIRIKVEKISVVLDCGKPKLKVSLGETYKEIPIPKYEDEKPQPLTPEANDSECRKWYEGDPILEQYHDTEWCKINHDDLFQFELLCLEGASVGLSWKTIMHKREAYKAAFHDFDIAKCAAMTDDELEGLLQNPNLIRNRSKIFSVRSNALAVQAIQKEFGSFDAYLWSFTDGKQIDGHWEKPEDVPTVSDVSRKMSADMKKRGIGYVGPTITYSFLQSIGIVNDHLADCGNRAPESDSNNKFRT